MGARAAATDLRAGEQVAATATGPVPLPIQGDGSQTRAFIHIDDFTDGLVTVIEHGEHLNIYHIGNPEEVSIAEVARKIVACFGREVDLVPMPEPPGATSRRCPDITKLAELGFGPRISFDAGLLSTVEWYVANSHLRPTQTALGNAVN